MAVTPVIGLVACLFFLFYGIFSGGSISSFYDLPSIYIVFGGTIGVVMLSTPPDILKNTGKLFKIAFSKKRIDPLETINLMVDLSYMARREGLLALENRAEEIEDPFLKKGLLLAVDGMESQIIRDILNSDIEAMEQRHKANRNIFDLASVIFPAFGMIGTLIGLIVMLKDLASPDKIGPQMAIALVTTFYGTVASNILCIPTSRALKAKTEQEVLVKEIMIEGIVAIQAGENTRFVEQKLLSFLDPKQRQAILGGE